MGILHRIALGRHCQHPQVVFVVAERDDFIIRNVEPFLQEGQPVSFSAAGVADEVGVEP